MQTKTESAPITQTLLDEIESLPAQRDVSHCGTAWQVSPFDIYADCPECGKRNKVRSFGGAEIQDVFDAVFAWMGKPGRRVAAEARMKVVQEDE